MAQEICVREKINNPQINNFHGSVNNMHCCEGIVHVMCNSCCEKTPEKYFFIETNFNLYHYAGNNPVKYVDPTGREDRAAQMLLDMYANGCTGNEAWNAYYDYANTKFNQGVEVVQQNISEGIEGGVKFMSKHGTEISLVCYASGNVELGIAIDGVTMACDITETITNYMDTGNQKQLKKDIAGIAVGIGVGIFTNDALSTGVKTLQKDITISVSKYADNIVSIVSDIASSKTEDTIKNSQE